MTRGPSIDIAVRNQAGTTCAELAGPARGTGSRRDCQRLATWEAWFLGEWRPLCRYHVGQYSDLPMHRITGVVA